jgi:hypothetical protein
MHWHERDQHLSTLHSTEPDVCSSHGISKRATNLQQLHELCVNHVHCHEFMVARAVPRNVRHARQRRAVAAAAAAVAAQQASAALTSDACCLLHVRCIVITTAGAVVAAVVLCRWLLLLLVEYGSNAAILVAGGWQLLSSQRGCIIAKPTSEAAGSRITSLELLLVIFSAESRGCCLHAGLRIAGAAGAARCAGVSHLCSIWQPSWAAAAGVCIFVLLLLLLLLSFRLIFLT